MRHLPLANQFFGWIFKSEPNTPISDNIFALYLNYVSGSEGEVTEAKLINEVDTSEVEMDSAFFAMFDLTQRSSKFTTVGGVADYLDDWYGDIRMMVAVHDTLARLQSMATETFSAEDVRMTSVSIKIKLSSGWLPSEIVDHMRNMEHVNPELDEDLALANMAKVQNKVRIRLDCQP